MVTLIAATVADCENAALIMGRAFKGHDFNWLPQGVAKGDYTATKIEVDGVPRFLVAHHVNLQNRCVVNAAVQLTRDYSDLTALVDACKQIARNLGCTAIEFITIRAGLVKQIMDHGFKPVGVCMELELA